MKLPRTSGPAGMPARTRKHPGYPRGMPAGRASAAPSECGCRGGTRGHANTGTNSDRRTQGNRRQGRAGPRGCPDTQARDWVRRIQDAAAGNKKGKRGRGLGHPPRLRLPPEGCRWIASLPIEPGSGQGRVRNGDRSRRLRTNRTSVWICVYTFPWKSGASPMAATAPVGWRNRARARRGAGRA